MAERRVTSAEIVRNFGELSDEALKEPITITKNGRDRLVLLAAEEYARLRRRDRQAIAIEDLPDDLVEVLEGTRMDRRHAQLDAELKGDKS